MAPVRRSVRNIGGFAAFVVAVAAGCALDFTVRPDSGDSGGGVQGGQAGDANEAGPRSDGGSDPDVIDARVPDGDRDPDAGPDCLALANDRDAKRANARKCLVPTSPSECKGAVKDQCDCDVVVAGNTAATDAYVAAVNAFKNSGCDKACIGVCPSADAGGTCLAQASGNSCWP